jgi:hypothetical protein
MATGQPFKAAWQSCVARRSAGRLRRRLAGYRSAPGADPGKSLRPAVAFLGGLDIAHGQVPAPARHGEGAPRLPRCLPATVPSVP